ncbi:rho-related GTP-binding protein RhoA-C-like isoform X2 [Stegostoma tigrinum]|uniref:rho-related GTP-binding protein RhoA-C-like isoform X2 n=1 Tax=Stegostoma tigrinum TaxID=3053191 RepID=UPI00202B6C3F|nr:rho-related GTP-binding protein RhoA-C-like isoform X2 [Stegostoma tigrinum]
MQSQVTSKYPVVKRGKRAVPTLKREPSDRGLTDTAATLRTSRDHLEMLKAFDLHWEYGPCCGITRMERWERANRMGLRPPQYIKEILLHHKKDTKYQESPQTHTDRLSAMDRCHYNQALKMVFVGDGGCGKTCLQAVFAEGHFPETYIPTVSDKFSAHFSCGSFLLDLSLWDTAGEVDYDRLRPLCYKGANVVLICYDVTNPISFQNVVNRWLPEVQSSCPWTPVMLVACKTDLRMNKACQRKLGQSMACRIQASGFLECSAKLGEKVLETFHEATLAALRGCRMTRKTVRGCLVS